MKKILLIITVAMLMAACNGSREEVVETYPNGNPKVVYIVKGEDANKIKIGEKSFYKDGKLHSEFHFKGNDEQPDGEWKYFYPDGKLFAKATCQDGKFVKWEYNSNGEQNSFLDKKYDTIVTSAMSESLMPVELHCVKGDSTTVMRLYDVDFKTQGGGLMVNNDTTGKWTYYYPNGMLQLEAIFIEGKRNGAYNSYGDNGIPYFRGFYINGHRAGVWEFYDIKGNFSGKIDYDAH